MSSPKPNETSAHPKTPAHDSHATHQPYVSAQPYGYLFPPPGLPHPQQQVGHPIMPGGPGSGALLNRFGSATPAPVHGQPMDPKSVPTRPRPRLLPRMNRADFILPDEFGSPFNTHTPSYRAPPVPPPLSPEIVSVGGGGNDSTKAKTKKVDKKVVVKPKSTVKDDNDDDSNDDDEPGPKRGRTKGSSQYTDKERTEIVRLVGKFLPIGGKSWDALADSYNSWAKKNGLPERKRPALQVQWGKIHKVAKIKPTGTATRPQILVDACAAGSAIEKKVALGDLQDEDVEDINIDDEEDNNEVLTITSDSDKDTNQKAAKKKGKKPAVGTVLTKAYKTEAPLRPTSRKTQSTNFLEKISLTLDPAAMQQRDENRSSANFQLLMLQSYQSQITTLTTQVNEERRRADDAESELRMLRMLHDVGRRSPSHRYYRRSSRSRSPIRHRYSYTPRSSRSPIRNERGSRRHYREVEYTPTRSPYASHYQHSRSHAHSTPPSSRRYRYPDPFHSRSPCHKSPKISMVSLHDETQLPALNSGVDHPRPQSTQPNTDGPMIASSSRLNLDDLASIAAGLSPVDG